MSKQTTQTCHQSNPGAIPFGPARKVLFASAHSIVDPSNGAAVATLDVLQGLAASGFQSQAFCTSKLDHHADVSLEKIITESSEPYQVLPSTCASGQAKVLYTRRHRVPITVVRLESTRQAPQGPEEVRTVLDLFRTYLEVSRPDVMLTYGGDPVSRGLIALARRRGIPVVFAIHNFSYTGLEAFRGVDYCVAPSDFACRYYRDRLSLACQPLPNPVDWDRVRVERRDPRFVTFVNPLPEKGVFPFVRIAHELGRRRPDIPLLVVESRGTRAVLAACGLGRDAAVNVQLMANTTDPRHFWSLTRIALLPSLWWENQPLVAIEAMINGIPVIGSDRGGTPETLGGAGFLLSLPDRLTPQSRIVPAAEEVEPWVETIIRLWDDRALYEEQSSRARQEARRWHPDRLRPLYAEFFGNVRRQAGPPFIGGRAGRGGSLISASPAADLDPSAVSAALWGGVPAAARQVLEVRWVEPGTSAGPARPAGYRFERAREPARGDSPSSSWKKLGEQALDVQAVDLVPSGVDGFDALLLDQVLESADDPAAWLRRLRRLLAPAGAIIAEAGTEEFYTLTGRFPGGNRADEPPRRLFSAESLTRTFRDAGLVPEIIGVVAGSHAPGASPSPPADWPGAPAGANAAVLAFSHLIVRARIGQPGSRDPQ